MANVLTLVPYKIFPPRFGGQKSIAQFNEYLSEYHNLFCVTIKANSPSSASYEIFNVLSDSKWRYANIFNFFRLRKILRQQEITHVILEHPYFGWLGWLVKNYCGVKLIIRSQNVEAERFHSLGKWWWKVLFIYERFIHRQADYTFCITREDYQYFLTKYGLAKDKLAVITFGIAWKSLPAMEEEITAKNFLREKFQLGKDTVIYLFNGAFNYRPNVTAVRNICDQIIPFIEQTDVPYQVLICGKDLPGELEKLIARTPGSVAYTGFVEDITIYLKGADVFINPITGGGGIKTKLVEALGFNKTSVSTINGGIGIDPSWCNGKLLLSADDDWKDFADKMIEAKDIVTPVGPEYYQHFYWDNIAHKAADIISTL